jgi:peptidoglycan/LPS O-acetylase OafA/YrhL
MAAILDTFQTSKPAKASTIQSFDEFQRRSYFDSLDGLRAISIVLVLLHHATSSPPANPLHILQENGRYGVGFFFLISGFLICTLFLREQARTGKISLWKFYGRRSVRLLPLYYAVLLLQAILVFGLHQYSPENRQLFVQKLPSYLFYYSNWLPTATQGPFFCAWSLAVEEQFYLAFGLLLFLANRRTAIVAVTLALVVKIIVYHVYGPVDAVSTAARIVFSYREPILLGVIIAFLLNQRKWHDAAKKWLGSPLVVVSLAIALVGWITLHAMKHESWWDSQLLYLLMGCVMVALVIRRHTPLVENRLMVHVGKISYGIYLLHMFVISAVRKLPNGSSSTVCFGVSLIVTVIAATFVYRYFEHPIIRYFKPRLTPSSRLENPRPNGNPAPALPVTQSESSP